MSRAIDRAPFLIQVVSINQKLDDARIIAKFHSQVENGNFVEESSSSQSRPVVNCLLNATVCRKFDTAHKLLLRASVIMLVSEVRIRHNQQALAVSLDEGHGCLCLNHARWHRDIDSLEVSVFPASRFPSAYTSQDSRTERLRGQLMALTLIIKVECVHLNKGYRLLFCGDNEVNFETTHLCVVAASLPSLRAPCFVPAYQSVTNSLRHGSNFAFTLHTHSMR
jgi:hypothetical protein